MEPISWTTIIGGLVTVIAAVIGFLKFRRAKRENLAQAETDELARGMSAVDATDKLRDVPPGRT